MSGSGYTGFQSIGDAGSTYNAHSFLISQLVNKLATIAVVMVKFVNRHGELGPVGLLDVQPMVAQIDGAGNPMPHEVINNLPYFRLQGGSNAIIIDPVVGDIGLALFCSRDISIVKRTKAMANPGSARKYDWADGCYLGGFLNGVPSQYIQFIGNNINVTSPGTVTVTADTAVVNAASQANVTAPKITMTASTEIDLNAPTVKITGNLTTGGGTVTMVGNIAATGTITSNGHAIDSTHRHLQSGGTGTGGVPV
jgi:phage baseplate assembly protein gpV